MKIVKEIKRKINNKFNKKVALNNNKLAKILQTAIDKYKQQFNKKIKLKKVQKIEKVEKKDFEIKIKCNKDINMFLMMVNANRKLSIYAIELKTKCFTYFDKFKNIIVNLIPNINQEHYSYQIAQYILNEETWYKVKTIKEG